jgi:hypothetical protein
MAKMSMQSIKDFFGTEEKPVTNAELIELRKADQDGYDELSRLSEAALGQSYPQTSTS